MAPDISNIFPKKLPVTEQKRIMTCEEKQASFRKIIELIEDKNFVKVTEILAEQFRADHSIIEYKDEQGNNLLHILASNLESVEIAIHLLENYDFKIDAVNNNAQTALHICAQSGNLKLAKYLIKDCKADIEARDNNNQRILHICAQENDLEFIKFLIKCKVRLTATDNNDYNSLHFAVENEDASIELIGLLCSPKTVNAGASFKSVKSESQSSIVKKATPLHIAARLGDIEKMEYLIGKGSDLNSQDSDEQTPLNYLQQYIRDNQVIDFEVQEIIEIQQNLINLQNEYNKETNQKRTEKLNQQEKLIAQTKINLEKEQQELKQYAKQLNIQEVVLQKYISQKQHKNTKQTMPSLIIAAGSAITASVFSILHFVPQVYNFAVNILSNHFKQNMSNIFGKFTLASFVLLNAATAISLGSAFHKISQDKQLSTDKAIINSHFQITERK